MYILFQVCIYIHNHMQIYTYNYLASRNCPIYNENKKARRWRTHCSPLWPPDPQGKNSRCAAMLKPVSRPDAEHLAGSSDGSIGMDGQ